MDKIWYFTTAQDAKNFEKELENFNIPPNLSNQNFHNKLIRCLSLSHTVEVISFRPINSDYKFSKINASEEKEKSINWHYAEVTKSKIVKFLSSQKQIRTMTKDMLSNDVIFVDALNLSLLKSAYQCAKRNRTKICAVCTDDPNNISFVNKQYVSQITKLINKADLYLCLTPQLNAKFNKLNKPSVVFEGLTEDFVSDIPIIKGDYIYFGGSLMKKYGVYELIEAFNQLKMKDLKLVLAGHHKESNLSALINNENILFLGSVSYAKNLNLEHYALCCINPRPLMPEIDELSFPSKVLEYLASGSITISTMNPLLEKYYSDSIVWAKSSNAEDLAAAIKKALSLSQLNRNSLSLKAKKDVLSRTSLQVINQKINSTLF